MLPCKDGFFVWLVLVGESGVSVNQFHVYGAEMCEENENFHDRTVRPVVGGQYGSSFVPSDQDKPTFDSWSCARKSIAKIQERVGKLSQQNRVVKFGIDAWFLTTVDVGKLFMTKDKEECSQITDSLACAEYILPRNEKSSDPKGWIRGNTKIGPVLEVTTPATYKVNMEWKLKLNLWIITIPIRGSDFPVVQNFSWLAQVDHGFEQQRGRRQRAGNLRDAVRHFFVALGKESGLMMSQKIFASRLTSVKTIENSSSSWWSTSKKDWAFKFWW